jgi:putative Holliday junction resolvase
VRWTAWASRSTGCTVLVGMPDRDIPRGYVLCFDFGLRRIGTAVGQATTRTASSLETVSNGDAPDWASINRLVKEWKPSQFLIGLPLDLEGNETDMSRLARLFGVQLERRFAKPCIYADERFSSQAAGERFVAMRASGQARRKDARQLDSVAAQLILQNWLQSLPVNPSPTGH